MPYYTIDPGTPTAGVPNIIAGQNYIVNRNGDAWRASYGGTVGHITSRTLTADAMSNTVTVEDTYVATGGILNCTTDYLNLYNSNMTNVIYNTTPTIINMDTGRQQATTNYSAWQANGTGAEEIRYTITNSFVYDPAAIYNGIIGEGGWYQPLDKRSEKLLRLKSNLIICRKARNIPATAESPKELVAMETLREMISESEYRKYLKYGFVMVKGKSGDTYQIFKNRSHTNVWRGGKLVEEICVRLAWSNIPKTDNVIAFKTMIESGAEDAFKKAGNVYKMANAA